ncbi:hypothetical protein EJ110_NYTH09702 [Nymphaea thermarum]|nr:hypothetical protein EJ110_NYTH09702 [Nymphaea thermarum]
MKGFLCFVEKVGRDLNSVLLLRIQLVSSLLDMLARPTFWGLPMELGLMLPFACAFFPGKQKRMVELLSGPVSCKHFQEIVHLMEHANASTYLDSSGTAILMADASTAMDHSLCYWIFLFGSISQPCYFSNGNSVKINLDH